MLPTDPAALKQYWFAVAVHEAGHAVVGAYLGFDVPELHLQSIGGETQGGAFIGTRTEWLAWWPAGDIAVEEICGDYRLPVDTNPNSDQERLRRDINYLKATDDEQRQGWIQAREIIRRQRLHVITIAKALLAAKDGKLEGEELEKLLAPVRAAS